MIVVIGAGLAGLVCTHELLRRGYRVCLLEAEETAGGRVRTEVDAAGFRLDRGFQVLFSAYPALRRHAPLDSLQPRYFSSGVAVVDGGKTSVLGHPLFDPAAALRAVTSGAVSSGDVLALLLLTGRSFGFGDGALPAYGISSRDALQAAGASDVFIKRVMQPLFGGISLDRSLSSDATFLGLVLRSLAVGRAFLPAYGVRALSDALASRLPPSVLRCGVPVRELQRDGERIVGVETAIGVMECETVVVATDAPAATRLTDLAVPVEGRSCTTAYFQSSRPILSGKRLTLNAGGSLVNQVVQLTNIAPTYAPPGRHLLAAVTLGVGRGSDDAVLTAMRLDLDNWLPQARGAALEPVGLIRVPFAQFVQPPGIYDRLPRSKTSVRNLYLAGEYLHSSSVQGAIRSGELAAIAVAREVPGV